MDRVDIWTYPHKAAFIVGRLDQFTDFLEALRQGVVKDCHEALPAVELGYYKGKVAFAILSQDETRVWVLGRWSHKRMQFTSFPNKPLMSSDVIHQFVVPLNYEPAGHYQSITKEMILQTQVKGSPIARP